MIEFMENPPLYIEILSAILVFMCFVGILIIEYKHRKMRKNPIYENDIDRRMVINMYYIYGPLGKTTAHILN